MTSSSSKRRRFALAVAVATLAGSVCLMTAVFAHPKPVSNGILGPDWQCQQILWLTSCTRVQPATPVRSGHQEPVVDGSRQV
jgi:hypothetical protein